MLPPTALSRFTCINEKPWSSVGIKDDSNSHLTFLVFIVAAARHLHTEARLIEEQRELYHHFIQ
jgi:hypothetical protein